MTHDAVGPEPGMESIVAQPSSRSAPRTYRTLVTDRSFGPFFGGRVMTTVGMWAHSITAAIVVFQLTRSAFLVGVVSAAQFLPQLVLTGWAGARSDRRDRRSQAITGLGIASVGSFIVVAWFLFVTPTGLVDAMVVIGGSSIVGLGYAIAAPPIQALLPALVRPQEIAQAVALNSLTVLIGRAAGPALGALAIAAGSSVVGFAMGGVANATFAVILGWVHVRSVQQARGSEDGSIRVAFRYLRTAPAIAAALFGVSAVAIGSDPVLTLTPAMAENLGRNSSFAGVMASAFGVGAGVAFVVLGRGVRRLGASGAGVLGLCLLAIGMGGLAVSPTAHVGNAALSLAGAGLTFGLTALTTLIQEEVPEVLRGRIMALWTIAWVGPRPAAATLSGALADALGVRVAIGLTAAVVAAAAVIVGASAHRRL